MEECTKYIFSFRNIFISRRNVLEWIHSCNSTTIIYGRHAEYIFSFRNVLVWGNVPNSIHWKCGTTSFQTFSHTIISMRGFVRTVVLVYTSRPDNVQDTFTHSKTVLVKIFKIISQRQLVFSTFSKHKGNRNK